MPKGRTFTLIQAGKGISQAVIGLNLAVAVANQSNKEVGLADLNIDSPGELELLFNLKVETSLVDILKYLNKMDSPMLKGYMSKHASGVSVMNAVSDLESANKIEPEHYEAFIKLLSESYEYIFINPPSQLNQVTLKILDLADMIFIVITPDLLSLTGARNILHRLRSLHFPFEQIKIINNMYDRDNALSEDRIEEFLKMEVFFKIADDPKVVIPSINEGTPPLLNKPHSSFSRAVKKLADKLVKAGNEYNETGEGLFSYLKGIKAERKEVNVEIEKEADAAGVSGAETKKETINKLKEKLHTKLLEELDMSTMGTDGVKDAQKQKALKKKTKKVIEHLLSKEETQLVDRTARSKLINELIDEVLGLGPLEEFLRDNSISEIMVNGPDEIYIEQHGKITLSKASFTGSKQLMAVIERIVAPLGRRIDESSPLVDARLADGSRVNVVIPPLSLVGPVITIRKFEKERFGIPELKSLDSVTQKMADFMRICVQLRKNIIISGGTGSGKTTLLNITSSFIPHDERIVTIEDSAELQLPQEHVVTLESRPPNIEGKGEISIRQLVINSLRMRPDRIVIGECRGGEALDMLQAMNTGHDGSLTTLHANSPRDSITRLITLVLLAGTELPAKAVTDQISSAIDIIIQTARLADGSRKVTKISEVIGINERGDIELQDIYAFHQEKFEDGKVIGSFKYAGNKPTFYEELDQRGIEYDKNIFEK
ncbi:MAG: ATPase, T2SS/T4P/T4SS family [Elusimicrobia bacterium]|jgi:pilus assembly protein CpaF|nr:ATPase, T2SS/T4P/T4SS family [Elusimicrobiota bacterium]